METQLKGLDPPAAYRRFSAVEGNAFGVAQGTLSDGELGCFYSHYLLLQMHLDGASHLHVIEDDTVMAHHAPFFLEQVVQSGTLDQCDLLFTETAVPMSLDFCKNGRDEFQSRIQRAADGTATNVRFGHVPYVAGTTSYLVNRRSIGLICDILGQELDRGATRPIDLLIREKAKEGKLRVECLFPFVTSFRPRAFASTTRPNLNEEQSRFAMEMLRHSFYVECDLKAALEQAERQLLTPDLGFQERLHYHLAGFIASGAYREF